MSAVIPFPRSAKREGAARPSDRESTLRALGTTLNATMTQLAGLMPLIEAQPEAAWEFAERALARHDEQADKPEIAEAALGAIQFIHDTALNVLAEKEGS